MDEYGYGQGQITDQMLCANIQGGGKDSCQGDSGGPLVTANPDLYEVIGVVSFGVGCALADYPGVYARVSKQLEWIGANTEGSWNTCARCPPGKPVRVSNSLPWYKHTHCPGIVHMSSI